MNYSATDLLRVHMELGPEAGIARRGSSYVVYYGNLRADALTLADAIELMRERISAEAHRVVAYVLA